MDCGGARLLNTMSVDQRHTTDLTASHERVDVSETLGAAQESPEHVAVQHGVRVVVERSDQQVELRAVCVVQAGGPAEPVYAEVFLSRSLRKIDLVL
jgi:hypothetical protein